MPGADTFTESAFTLHRLEDFVPNNHPLRPIRQMVNEALVKMDELFAGMYEADIKGGRPSIAPEKLLRAMLLQVLYSIRSERQLMEQVQYNLLYRWFIGLSMEVAVWVPTVFTKNRERVLAREAVIELFNQENTVKKRGLIVVDLQNEYLPTGKLPLVGIEAAAANAARVIADARSKGIAVFHIRHEFANGEAPVFVPGSDGVQIQPAVAPVGDEPVIVKNHINSFR